MTDFRFLQIFHVVFCVIAHADCSTIVESLFKISVDKLRCGEKVVISGFGVFSVALSAARIGRNPRTGAAVKIAPRRTVRFRSRIDVDSGYEAAGDELEA